MARKGWGSLSAAYRSRLEKAGISKRDYEGGTSIKAARGHQATPERPTQAAAFPAYQTERNRLVRLVTIRKQHFFGTSPKWNPSRAAAKFTDMPPPMHAMKAWVKFSREEWLDAIRENPEAAAYLGYH